MKLRHSVSDTALLKKKKIRALAERSGLTQGAISRALNLTVNLVNTIIRIASGFDVAFVGRFVPFSELIDAHEDTEESVDLSQLS